MATREPKKDGPQAVSLEISLHGQPCGQPANRQLTVSDVHRDFEAETQVGCCGGGPCHGDLLIA